VELPPVSKVGRFWMQITVITFVTTVTSFSDPENFALLQ